MRLGGVIGNVVATRAVAEFGGRKLLLVQEIDEDGNELGEPVIAVDTVDAGQGNHVFFVTSREASTVFPQAFAAADAAIVGIVEGVE